MQAHRLPPACDLCHLKKIRCDRRSPCANCTLAKTACLRERPKNAVPVNRFDSTRMDEMIERMSQLEKSIRQASSGGLESHRVKSTTEKQASILAPDPSSVYFSPRDASRGSVQEDVQDEEHRGQEQPNPSPETVLREGSSEDRVRGPGKRRAHSMLSSQSKYSRIEKGDVSDESESPECQALASVDLQRYFCNNPGSAKELARERQIVLESAIRLAKQVASIEPKLEGSDEVDQGQSAFYNPKMYPVVEFLQTALDNETRNVATAYFLEFNETVSRECLEHMGLSLIECSVHGQLRLRYIICVNYLAYAFLTAMDSSSNSNKMYTHLRRARARYRRNVLAALKHLDTQAEPELSLLQALVSAAMLMQDIGNMRGCWRLNRIACRVCASLNQGPLRDSIPEQDWNEIRMISIKCYVFDKALSAHVYQPACSDILEVDSTILIPTRPGHAMLLTLLEIASVQDAIVRETRHWNSLSQAPSTAQDRVVKLQQRMVRIAKKIQLYRSQAPCCDNEFLSFEWLNLEFIYYSMMTSVVRLSMKGSDPKSHRECLLNARSALATLTVMLEFSSRPSSFADKCVNSLAWVVPLFPLRPIYFVFSNLVNTSDAYDLKLLQDVSKGLAAINQSHYSLMEIKRLCDSLVELYIQFLERMRYGRNMGRWQLGGRGLAGENSPKLNAYDSLNGRNETAPWSQGDGLPPGDLSGVNIEDVPFPQDLQLHHRCSWMVQG